MRKPLLFFLILLISLISIYFIFSSKFNLSYLKIDHNSREDTIQAKVFLEKGDRLRGSNQDSCKYYYNKAIAILQLLPQSKRNKHLSALAYVGIAALNCNMGNYPESEKNLLLAMGMDESGGDLDIKAQSINIKGLLYYNQSKYDSAVVCYQEALSLARTVNNKKLQAKLYTNMAIIDYLQGKCDPAIESFSKTLAIAEELNDVDLITGTYINMGLTANNFGQYPKAIGFYEKAIETYKKIDGKDGLILCYQNLGTLYLSLGKYNLAIETIDQSLKLAEEIGDKTNIAMAHHNLAEVFGRVGDYQQAMEEYLISIRQKEGLNDKSKLADGYNGIGTLYFQHSEYQKALEYFEKALKINEELNVVRGMATNYSNIANIYAAQHLYNEAIIYYNKGLALTTRIKNQSSIADFNVSLGATYSKMGNFDKSAECLKNGLQIKNEIGEKDGIAMVYMELANSALNQANASLGESKKAYYKQAVDYGLVSYKLAKELKEIPVVNMASMALKHAYKGLCNSTEALRFAEEFSISNDSLFSKQKAEAIIYSEARWSVEKYQKKINSLESEKKLQEALLEGKEKEALQQKVIIYIGIVLLVMVVAFVFFLIAYNKRSRDILYQKQLNCLTALKLKNIRNRMSPHFIFNMLSSVYHSIHEPEVAKKKIGTLSVLLRKIIENIENTALPLEEELEIVKAYVELKKDKLPMPFYFEVKIEPGVNPQMLVPAMIVQIPVENAIKHGLMPLENGLGELIVSVQKMVNASKINISDNGIGLKASIGKTAGTGTGLKMILQTIYFLNSKNKEKMSFTLSDNRNEHSDSGSVSTIIIPNEFKFDL